MRTQDFNFKPGQRLQVVVPDGNYPAGEFLVTHYRHDKRWIPIELHPNQPVEVQRKYAVNNAVSSDYGIAGVAIWLFADGSTVTLPCKCGCLG